MNLYPVSLAEGSGNIGLAKRERTTASVTSFLQRNRQNLMVLETPLSIQTKPICRKFYSISYFRDFVVQP